MKISEIKKSYFILFALVLIVSAFFVYVWFDTQRLAKALSSEPDSGTANKTDIATNETKPTKAEIGQADQLKPDNPEVSESKPEQNKNKTEEASKKNKSEAKTAENPKTLKTDDWMFEKGENIESQKTKADESSANSTSE